MRRRQRMASRTAGLVSLVMTAALAFPVDGAGPSSTLETSGSLSPVMLILRGIASPEYPRGQLDDESALEYARRTRYQGEVIDTAGNSNAKSPQIRIALERIRGDQKIAAIYGFSGGGYSTRRIWSRLNDAERRRIAKIVVIGSPGVNQSDFAGSTDVLIKQD